MRFSKQWAFVVVVGVAVCVGGLWAGATRWAKAPASDTGNNGGHSAHVLAFREAQDEAGIRFEHFNAPRASLLPEDVGSGAGWGDYDGDGDEDLYLVNFAGPFLMDEAELKQRPGNRLYRNDGNGRFTDVTAEAGVGHVGWDYACL